MRCAVLIAVLVAGAGCGRTAIGFTVCLPPDGVFELHYVHSVERTPVVEIYRVRGEAIVLDGMRFRSGGWGLPSEGYVRRGTWFVVSGLGRVVGTLRLRVTSLNRYALVAGGRTIHLSAHAHEGAPVTLAAAAASGCAPALRVELTDPGPAR